MSESKTYERQIGAKASTQPRGKFRPNADGDDIALGAYRAMYHPLRGYLTPNSQNPRTGKPIPRVNDARRALRNVARSTVAL